MVIRGLREKGYTSAQDIHSDVKRRNRHNVRSASGF